MIGNKVDEFRKEARKEAEEKGFGADNIYFCIECGDTTALITIPSVKDDVASLYCTCESPGPPMIPAYE